MVYDNDYVDQDVSSSNIFISFLNSIGFGLLIVGFDLKDIL